METKADSADTRRHDFLVRHQVRFEVAPYFVLLDERPEGGKPHTKKIQAGYDIDLYAEGSDHKELPAATNGEVHEIVNDLVAACKEISKELPTSHIEIIPFPSTLILDIHRHLEPEALVRIRISHFRGLDQPMGPDEETALAQTTRLLVSMGARKK